MLASMGASTESFDAIAAFDGAPEEDDDEEEEEEDEEEDEEEEDDDEEEDPAAACFARTPASDVDPSSS